MAEKVGLPGSSVEMPMRQVSGSSDHAVPASDPNDTPTILAERLQAWKHAVGYLEDYVGATEKIHKAHSKEYEKVLKTIANPLREAHHFEQSLGGVAGMFENMRVNTQSLVNSHLETEKNLKGSVLPILERLHKEIKNKSKELSSGAAKTAKEVEKARATTQKHIELLGQQTANHAAAGGNTDPSNDPYVLQRGVYYRLNKQVLEENNNKHNLIAVQNNFAQFESHVVEVIQQAMMSFNQFVGGQAQRTQALYQDMLAQGQQIPPDFEWQRFVGRSGHMLVNPNEPDRSVDAISFPNQNHKSTKPLIEGTLERKSRNKLSMHGYSTGYYVVTPSRFLHEFKDNDNYRKDPVPELSIFLPDAVIGTTNGEKFNVKGKDVSGGLGSKLSGSSEIAFKAHTAADAQRWFEVIRSVSGAGPNLGAEQPTSPVSPTERRVVSQPPTYSEDEAEFVPRSLDPNPRPPSPTYPLPQQRQTSGVIGGDASATRQPAT